jgi:hypothetical protein
MEGFMRQVEFTHTLMERYSDYFKGKAQSLLRDGAASLTTSAGVIDVRLVRFWNGAMLDCEMPRPSGTGRTSSRLNRHELADPVPLITRSLAGAVAKAGLDAWPIG